MFCVPGSKLPCYDGPANTEDKGLCHAGERTCNPDGQAYGACIGQVLPVPETCNTPGDDDCNGVVNDQGVGCACVAGATSACYDGPVGTENQGICKSGTRTCDAQGQSFGPCMNQTLPMVEDCTTVADENCDGLTPPCPGTTIWSHNRGDTVDDEANSVAIDNLGNVIIGGYGTLNPDFGCGPMVIGPNYSALIYKLTPDGNNCLWQRNFVSNGLNHKAEVKAVTTDPAGNIFAAGIFFNGIRFNDGISNVFHANTSVDESDVYLAKFDPQGKYLWSKPFGSSGSQVLKAIKADSQGNVYITGMFANTINFGGVPATNLISGGQLDIFLAKFDPMGTHLWSKKFGDFSQQAGYGVTVDPADNVIITGPNYSTVNCGGGNMSSQGLADPYVCKFSPAGVYMSQRQIGAVMDQTPLGIAVDAAGNLAVVGTFAGTLNFGNDPAGNNVSITSVAGNDAWIVKLAPDLKTIWAKRGGGPDNQEFDSVTSDPMGNFIASGFLSGSGDFGFGNLVNAGAQDMLVVKYDANGTPIFSKRFGGAGTELGRSIASNAAGETHVTGVCGPTDFGSGVQAGLGGEELCIVKLSP